MDKQEKKLNSVLIIDDDIWMQRILSKTLQSYGFKDTFLASNGFDGIAIAVEFVPILIIMDILMPELSGHLTLKILKTIKTTKDIPVFMVSAMSDTENLGMAVKYGTAGFISKPFTRATVYEKLVSIFGKEKLDQIAKGEETNLAANDNEESYPISDRDSLLNIDIDNSPLTLKEEDTPQTIRRIPQDQLLQHYQDDERRNIESIKKLLLKTKK
jgi:CheY-like chemotaxis protein